LFYFTSVIDYDEPPWLVVISLFFSSSVEGDDELGGSSSFVFSSVADDNELPWLIVISLFFFSNVPHDGEPP